MSLTKVSYSMITGSPINVLDYGAVVNTDSTAAIQAAINACPDGGIVLFPPGNFLIYTQLSVSKGITLQGCTQYTTALITFGCSGLIVNSISNFQMHNIEFATSVRHTTTPNAFVGIEVTGSTGTRPFNHIYRDVFLDGYQTGFKSAWLWATVFDNFRVSACKFGMATTGLSVNIVVTACSIINGNGAAGSIGIFITGQTEGWMISDTLIDDFEIGIQSTATAYVFVSNCIIDHNRAHAILIADNGGADFGGNWTIRGCYLAVFGASADAVIKSTNTISNYQNTGNVIIGNQLLAYAGTTCLYGIWMYGSAAYKNIISGNTINNFTTNDIRTNSGQDIVTNNICQSSIATNIRVAGTSIVKDNIGSIYFEEFTQYETLGQNKVTWSYSIPTSGTWVQGDICYKSNAVASGYIGWVCTTGGTPGTWKTFGAISA